MSHQFPFLDKSNQKKIQTEQEKPQWTAGKEILQSSPDQEAISVKYILI